MLPEKDQDRAGQVTLQKVNGYFQNLNERLKTYNPAKRAELFKAQEDPDMNPMGVSHRQVKAATESMLTVLNSSLKETNQTYGIEFREQGDLFSLDFVMTTKVGEVPVTLRFSLLDKSGVNLQDGSEIRETLLRASRQKPGIRISNYSLDATDRYFEMYRETFTDSCQIESLQYNTPEDLEPISAVHVSYESFATRAEQALKIRADAYNESSYTFSDFDFYVSRDNVNCINHPGTFLVYFKNRRHGTGYCFQEQGQAVSVNGTTTVFLVDGDSLEYTQEQSGTTRMHGAANVFHLLSAGSYQGVPTVTYLTTDGQIETWDINGRRVRLRTPVAPLRQDDVSINFYSNRDGVSCQSAEYRLMYVEGRRWGNGTCYPPAAKGVTYFGQPFVFVKNGDGKIELFHNRATRQEIPGVVAVQSIVSARIADNVPVVTYIDASGETKTVNLKGEAVSL